jgi:alpha-1,3-fucosyltransferase
VFQIIHSIHEYIYYVTDTDPEAHTTIKSPIHEDMPGETMATQGIHSNNSDIKKILFWNPWYHRKAYGFGYGQEPFHIYDCPEKRCSTTEDLDDFNDADAVVVCGRLLNWDAEPVVPPRRDPDQVYVYFNREAPVTQMGNNHLLKNIFNITMTYRLDSTIPFPYSIIIPKKDRSNYKEVTLDDIKDKSLTNPISWMVSRCHKSGCVRYEYAIDLSKYITVDIYGRCGNLKCSRTDNGSCMIMQERQYKFYLAFENTVCEDYVTEKAFRTLQYNIVPIIMGGANYTKILPPHSFVDVRDFQSPQQLAEYLQFLVDNDEEYLKYFQWKRDFEIKTLGIHEPFCKLCELLHKERKFLVDFDLEDWWDTKSGEVCMNEGYRAELLKYFNIDPTIDLLPRTHEKLLKLRSSSQLNDNPG